MQLKEIERSLDENCYKEIGGEYGIFENDNRIINNDVPDF